MLALWSWPTALGLVCSRRFCTPCLGLWVHPSSPFRQPRGPDALRFPRWAIRVVARGRACLVLQKSKQTRQVGEPALFTRLDALQGSAPDGLAVTACPPEA